MGCGRYGKTIWGWLELNPFRDHLHLPGIYHGQEAQIQVSKSILQAEHSLKGKLPDSPRVEVLSSWLQLIQHTLLFLNETCTLPNVSHCFLCVSLQRPLLGLLQEPKDMVNVSLP